MATVTVVQARTQLGDLLARAAYSNERTLVTRNGKPIAAIVSPRDLRALQAIEDAEDVRDALAALKEVQATGTTIPLETLARKHGVALGGRSAARKRSRAVGRKR